MTSRINKSATGGDSAAALLFVCFLLSAVCLVVLVLLYSALACFRIPTVFPLHNISSGAAVGLRSAAVFAASAPACQAGVLDPVVFHGLSDHVLFLDYFTSGKYSDYCAEYYRKQRNN